MRAYSPSRRTSAPHTRHARGPSGSMSKISNSFDSESDDVDSLMRPGPVVGSPARDQLLQSPLPTGLAAAVTLWEGHHRLARTSRLCRALGGPVPRAAPPGRRRVRAVQLRVVRLARIH